MEFYGIIPKRRNVKTMKNIQGKKRRLLFLIVLIGIGIILGSIIVYTLNLEVGTGSWELELENGKIVLDAQDRTELKKKALTITLEEKEIKELLTGKDYTTQVTLTGNAIVENIIFNQTRQGLVAKGDVNLLVVVTVFFEDGSGYNIPVDWRNWTVGTPEFSEKVSPPEDQFRIAGLTPTERKTYFP